MSHHTLEKLNKVSSRITLSLDQACITGKERWVMNECVSSTQEYDYFLLEELLGDPDEEGEEEKRPSVKPSVEDS